MHARTGSRRMDWCFLAGRFQVNDAVFVIGITMFSADKSHIHSPYHHHSSTDIESRRHVVSCLHFP